MRTEKWDTESKFYFRLKLLKSFQLRMTRVWSLYDFWEIIYDPCMTTKNSYKSHINKNHENCMIRDLIKQEPLCCENKHQYQMIHPINRSHFAGFQGFLSVFEKKTDAAFIREHLFHQHLFHILLFNLSVFYYNAFQTNPGCKYANGVLFILFSENIWDVD